MTHVQNMNTGNTTHGQNTNTGNMAHGQNMNNGNITHGQNTNTGNTTHGQNTKRTFGHKVFLLNYTCSHKFLKAISDLSTWVLPILQYKS